ncbi:MAG: caspase family protein, partial [Deltaproteobacteria bacterium]
DARAIGSTLQQLGFEVTTLVDADQRKMERAIRDFGDELRSRRGVGLFYYAGHGMQFDSENYLLPTDINPSTEDDVRYDAVPLGKMLAQMRAADNAMNVVILDACRNNPFSRSFRTFSPGLAQINAAAGTFISFATAPGQVAADGDGNNGNNGLFTSKLLEHLRTPGLKIEEVFKRTTADVYRASNERQAPWVQYSVIGDFYFSPGKVDPPTVGVKPKEVPIQLPKPAKEVVWSGKVAMNKLLETKECSGCDLSGVDLGYAELSKANLRQANLQGTSLKSADLTSADLSGTNITNATLRNSELGGANLQDADLTNTSLVLAFLGEANLTNTILRNADLKFATLHRAKFCNTTMPDGYINNQDCEQPVQDEKLKPDSEWGPEVAAAKELLLETRMCVRCSLRGVNLSAVDLSRTDLDTANLSLANLSRTNLTGAYLVRVNLI